MPKKPNPYIETKPETVDQQRLVLCRELAKDSGRLQSTLSSMVHYATKPGFDRETRDGVRVLRQIVDRIEATVERNLSASDILAENVRAQSLPADGALRFQG